MNKLSLVALIVLLFSTGLVSAGVISGSSVTGIVYSSDLTQKISDANVQVYCGYCDPRADFNEDGTVDQADYTQWYNSGGNASSYDLWYSSYGCTFNGNDWQSSHRDTISNETGGYSVTFSESECLQDSTIRVTAEKDGLQGENYGSRQVNVNIINVPLVPEFSLIIGSLTLVSAVVVFLVVRRR